MTKNGIQERNKGSLQNKTTKRKKGLCRSKHRKKCFLPRVDKSAKKRGIDVEVKIRL